MKIGIQRDHGCALFSCQCQDFAVLSFGHPNLAYLDTFKSKIA